jgi:hypothetical protein
MPTRLALPAAILEAALALPPYALDTGPSAHDRS